MDGASKEGRLLESNDLHTVYSARDNLPTQGGSSSGKNLGLMKGYRCLVCTRENQPISHGLVTSGIRGGKTHVRSKSEGQGLRNVCSAATA